MVGEEEVKQSSNFNGLSQGAGEIDPLSKKGNFEERPHHLPDWNDLPHECREAMSKAACWFTQDWESGQCALDIYNELKKTFPAPVFPLFQPRGA